MSVATRTTETECLEALREAAERLGESPTKAEYEDLGLRPASATIIRAVGGWNEAKEKAGLDSEVYGTLCQLPQTGTLRGTQYGSRGCASVVVRAQGHCWLFALRRERSAVSGIPPRER